MVKKFSIEKEMTVLEAKTLIAKIESKLIIIKNNNNDNEFFCSICSEKKLRKYSTKFNTLRDIASIHFDRNFDIFLYNSVPIRDPIFKKIKISILRDQ